MPFWELIESANANGGVPRLCAQEARASQQQPDNQCRDDQAQQDDVASFHGFSPLGASAGRLIGRLL
jgi:hypothetical protein